MPPHTASQRSGDLALQLAARLWFATAALGQATFAGFILGFVLPRLSAGDLPALNAKPHITGYVTGDPWGNAQLLMHLLLGAVMTLSGLLQLLPALRRALPALHRWNGRLFMLAAVAVSLSGFYLTWGRGSAPHLGSDLSTSANGALILIAVALAWRSARSGDTALHRRHALRAYLLVNGVWFLRLGMMLTAVAMAASGRQLELHGPIFLAVSLLSWTLPLALLQLYFTAQSTRSGLIKHCVAGLLVVLALATAAAGVLAWMYMWRPYL